MASPTAMAKCLRADAKVMAGTDAAYAWAEKVAAVVLNEAVVFADEQRVSKTLNTVIFMLAAAAALEAEDE